MKMRNKTGPKTLPRGTPALTGEEIKGFRWELHDGCESRGSPKPCVELALDVISSEFREQGRMPDYIKSTTYVQTDGPDLMSDIEGLHSLLSEKKQHVQGGVTWSETQLVIWDDVGGKEGFHINCDDGFHELADDGK